MPRQAKLAWMDVHYRLNQEIVAVDANPKPADPRCRRRTGGKLLTDRLFQGGNRLRELTTKMQATNGS